MQWAACCLDHNDPAPMFLWDRETEEENEFHKEILEEENNASKAAGGIHRANALIPGTQEHRILQETNANIQRRNQELSVEYGRKVEVE